MVLISVFVIKYYKIKSGIKGDIHIPEANRFYSIQNEITKSEDVNLKDVKVTEGFLPSDAVMDLDLLVFYYKKITNDKDL